MRSLCFTFFMGLFTLTSVLNAQTGNRLEAQQAMAESSVEKHIRSSMQSLGTYSGYGFGDVQVLIPREILYLNELREGRKTAEGMKEYFGNRHDSVLRSYDTLISRQERVIKEKKVRDNYKITHIFSLKSKEKVRLMEGEFFLSANFKVKDVRLKMDVNLTFEENEWFLFFIKGSELFYTGTQQENVIRSAAVYDHYSSRLESFQGDKSELVLAILEAIHVIRVEQKYNPASIASAVIQNYMKRRPADFPVYMPGDFSKIEALYQTVSGKDVLVGYSVFHRFSVKGEGGMPELRCLYFELDPWFVVAGTMIAEAPYDRYFESR